MLVPPPGFQPQNAEEKDQRAGASLLCHTRRARKVCGSASGRSVCTGRALQHQNVRLFLPDNFRFMAQHSLLSVSVPSNVPSYESPKCFVVGGEGREHEKRTVEEFVAYLEEIAQKAHGLELERYTHLMTTVEETLCPGGFLLAEQQEQQRQIPSQVTDSQAREEEDDGDCTVLDGDESSESESEEEEETEEDAEFIDDEELEEPLDPSFYHRVNLKMEKAEEKSELPNSSLTQVPNPQLKKGKQLVSSLLQHIGELVVVGFNSGKYDINVLKDILIPHLVNNQGIKFVIQKNQAYLALKSGSLKFLDVSNFLAADSSYAAFLKAYDCSVEKACFPYEYVDSPEKLKEPQLPPHSAFYSWLKKSNITDEEYVRKGPNSILQEVYPQYPFKMAGLE